MLFYAVVQKVRKAVILKVSAKEFKKIMQLDEFITAEKFKDDEIELFGKGFLGGFSLTQGDILIIKKGW